MSEPARYEIKFVLDDIRLAEFERWMWTRLSVREAYPQRMVNSVYFDDVNLQSVQDNLAGLADRSKLRLRWYESEVDETVRELKLERKFKRGRLGYKRSRPLDMLAPVLLEQPLSRLAEQAETAFAALGLYTGGQLPWLIPVLHTRYQRRYFEDADGLRITLDDRISFTQLLPESRIHERAALPSTDKIVELKFTPALKPRVSAQLRGLHLMPQRNSKYLSGLAMGGRINY